MTTRSISAAVSVAIALLCTGSATSTAAEELPVRTDVISHETTEDIHVWAPASEGANPVVYAMHGTCDLCGGDWDVIGEALAASGVVVFGVDYHGTDYLEGRFDRMTRELECGYRFARESAADYGGDLERPVVFIGHSWGATMSLAGGLDHEQFVPDGTYDACFEGAERPDAVVAIAGCHYEHQGVRFGFDAAAYGSGDAAAILVGGAGDEECAAWQSVDAAAQLAGIGLDATPEVVPDANHYTLIGHDIVDDEWITLADHPAVVATIQIILNAIEQADGSPEAVPQPSN